MSDWIEHDGKEMPVPGDTVVDVRFRDGTEMHDTYPCMSDSWKHIWGDADIIAYRLSEVPPITSSSQR